MVQGSRWQRAQPHSVFLKHSQPDQPGRHYCLKYRDFTNYGVLSVNTWFRKLSRPLSPFGLSLWITSGLPVIELTVRITEAVDTLKSASIICRS